jgi:NAD(P)-dependent dehydrogenase (short-subunit alcohol dehydrogenase family)
MRESSTSISRVRVSLPGLGWDFCGGDVVVVRSIAGWKEGTGLVAYTASKHGAVGILRGWHLSAVREGVGVNVVCPWMTSMFSFSLLGA